MFDLQKFKDNTAVVTDRSVSLTYSQLQEQVDEFYRHKVFYSVFVRMYLPLL